MNSAKFSKEIHREIISLGPRSPDPGPHNKTYYYYQCFFCRTAPRKLKVNVDKPTGPLPGRKNWPLPCQSASQETLTTIVVYRLRQELLAHWAPVSSKPQELLADCPGGASVPD